MLLLDEFPGKTWEYSLSPSSATLLCLQRAIHCNGKGGVIANVLKVLVDIPGMNYG